ncbi:MAG TPA: excinuclease ABC subunit UvrC [Xanthomonadales bacterium]|nr:excinuclease ABC subunit UvrC [Xanthomonadales bacterium]
MSVSEEIPFDPKAYVRTLTSAPGVYRMLDAAGAALYVGKAGSLKKRVGSYFMKPALDPRIATMLSKVAGIEVTITRTEGEALLLENELIKSLKPRYNVLLRDDKSYPWIYLSAHDDYPRMGFHRGARSAAGRYFGPFPSAHAVRESLSLMQKLFKVRQCEDSYFRNRSRPCLQYQIGRCSAPCVNLVTVEDYGADVRHAALFLDGQSTKVVDELGTHMERAAAALEFEKAARIRDQIATLRQVQAKQFVAATEEDADVLVCRNAHGLTCVHAMFFRNGMNLGGRTFFPRNPTGADEAEVLGSFVMQYYLERPPPSLVVLSHPVADAELIGQVLGERRGRAVSLRSNVRGDRARLVEMGLRNADHAIATEVAGRANKAQRWTAVTQLLGLDHPPARIECFDISHSHGEATVASCVVFGPEGPVKSLYRRFNIEGVAPGDDYGAMRQAIERRFRRLQAEGADLPDVLLIDGGRGQVAETIAVLGQLGVAGVDVVGVAKGESRRAGLETLILAQAGRELRPDAAEPGLHLIQQVRDEAHRFAITGHRARRQKKRDRSTLEDIPGIGARRRALLLKHFGGLAGVMAAGPEELSQVKGIDAGLAKRIYDALHE